MASADDEILAYQRATRRKRMILVGAVIAVAASPFAYVAWSAHHTIAQNDEYAAEQRKARELDDRERTELRKILADSATTLADARTRWKAAVAPDALAQLAPGDGPCPVRLRAPDAGAGDGYVEHASIDGTYFGDLDYTLFPSGAPVGENPQLAGAEKTLARIAEALRNDTATKEQLREAREAVAPRHTVFIVGTKRDPSTVSGGATPLGGVGYTEGQIAGVGYLYAFAQGRIVCAGDVEITNTPGRHYEYSQNLGAIGNDYEGAGTVRGALDRDLEVQAKRALATQLHSVR